MKQKRILGETIKKKNNIYAEISVFSYFVLNYYFLQSFLIRALSIFQFLIEFTTGMCIGSGNRCGEGFTNINFKKRKGEGDKAHRFIN